MEKEKTRDRIIVRFKIQESGQKPVKPGDPLVNQRGECIGNVTSAAFDAGGMQVGLAYVLKKAAKPQEVGIFSLPPENRQKAFKAANELSPKAKTLLPIAAKIVSRFPAKKKIAEKIRTEAHIAIESAD